LLIAKSPSANWRSFGTSDIFRPHLLVEISFEASFLSLLLFSSRPATGGHWMGSWFIRSSWPLALWLTISVSLVAQSGAACDPLAPGEHSVELNGIKLWYKVAGEGPVCLMPTPAWGQSSDLYFLTLHSLERYFTVVYIDSRGTGRSSRAATLKHYTWDHLNSDLESLREFLHQDRVWLMGHSAGGIQVLHYATRHPNRVSGMVLLSTQAVLSEETEKEVLQRMALHAHQPWYGEASRAFQSHPRTDDEMARMFQATLPLDWRDHRNAEVFRDAFAAMSFSATALAGVRESRRHRVDLRPLLNRLSAPALIISGKDDFICCPASAQALHRALPSSKLVLISQCGHFPWMEQPEIFQSSIGRFFASLQEPIR
jgi:proline iminopeptidase